MAEMFKENGYSTYLIGKWHLGFQPEMRPNRQGFDYSFGHLVGCIDNYSISIIGEAPTVMTSTVTMKKFFSMGNISPTHWYTRQNK